MTSLNWTEKTKSNVRKQKRDERAFHFLFVSFKCYEQNNKRTQTYEPRNTERKKGKENFWFSIQDQFNYAKLRMYLTELEIGNISQLPHTSNVANFRFLFVYFSHEFIPFVSLFLLYFFSKLLCSGFAVFLFFCSEYFCLRNIRLSEQCRFYSNYVGIYVW